MIHEETILIKSNRLEVYKLEFIEDFKDFKFLFKNGLPNNISVTYSTCGSDGIYSIEHDISSINKIGIVDGLKIYLKNSGSEDFELKFDISYTSIQKQKDFGNFIYKNSINIQNFGNNVIHIEKSLNSFINANDGICVTYFRTEPKVKDVILREYTSKKYVEKKNLNILTKDNELPAIDGVEITDWGAEYNTFDAEVDFKYFESIFGVGIIPRDDDYIYIKQINTMYSLQSSILMRGVNGEPTHWKLIFGNYNEDSTIDDIEDDDMRDRILKNETLFKDEITEEITDILNLSQNMSSQIYRDMNRTIVSGDMIFGDNEYTMYGGSPDSTAVEYTNKITNNKYCIAFIINAFDNTKIFDIGGQFIEIIDNKFIVFGRNTNISINNDNKRYVLINVSEEFNSIHILENDTNGIKEVVYYDTLIKPLNIPIGQVKLLFGQYNISRIRIFNKLVPKEYSARLMSKKELEKPSTAYIIDDAEDINNNPRAIESNFKPD